MKNRTKRKKSIALRIMLAFWVFIIALNIASWLSAPFSTWYADHVMIIWVNTYSRLTGLVPFSVGEIMLTIAVILAVAAVLTLILLVFIYRKRGFRTFARRFYKTLFVIITIVCLLMTLNCTILYHAEFIDPNPDIEAREYSVSELKKLEEYITVKCNEYSQYQERGVDDYLNYYGDLQSEAKEAMNNLAAVYPRLGGFYPDVKLMMYSSLMSQMYMGGYYFPFSGEANCNKLMYMKNMPNTYCHELSHLHGYIYEDEANFIAFLACINSDDDFFVYSGYMSVLNYVRNAYKNNVPGGSLTPVNKLVEQDNLFLTSEMWEKVEEKAVLDTQTVTQISSDFTDATLKLNGVEDGMASYDRVVGLLLEYYDGALY